MRTLDAQVTISRTGGGLSLDTPGQFELVAVGVGGRTWRRSTVDGPFMHGRVLLGAVLEQETLTVIARVRGTTWIAAMNRTQELFDALAQQAYTATVTIEGRTDVYTCEPADIRNVAGDTVSKFHAMSQMQEYQLTIPIQPGGIS